MERKDAIDYPAQYRSDLLAALQKLDLPPVAQAIGVFLEARTLNRRIFVCGCGVSARIASQYLIDLVKGSGFGLSTRFRVLALSDQHFAQSMDPKGEPTERVFVDQLQNFAEFGDVVMGISSEGKAASLVRAFEYAGCIGCRTVALTGSQEHPLAPLSDVHIWVPASQTAGVEDGLMIVCHMIGSYFQRFDTA